MYLYNPCTAFYLDFMIKVILPVDIGAGIVLPEIGLKVNFSTSLRYNCSTVGPTVFSNVRTPITSPLSSTFISKTIRPFSLELSFGFG